MFDSKSGLSFHFKTAASGFARSRKTLMPLELYTLLGITHKPGILLHNNMERLAGLGTLCSEKKSYQLRLLSKPDTSLLDLITLTDSCET